MQRYTKPLKENESEEKDELTKQGYEKSPERRKNPNPLSFNVDFDRYDSKGRELEDSDLYPLKTVIPPSNRPKPLSEKDKDKENDFFENIEKDEDDEFEDEEITR
jgi:hypothetical protein